MAAAVNHLVIPDAADCGLFPMRMCLAPNDSMADQTVVEGVDRAAAEETPVRVPGSWSVEVTLARVRWVADEDQPILCALEPATVVAVVQEFVDETGSTVAGYCMKTGSSRPLVARRAATGSTANDGKEHLCVSTMQ